MHVTLEGEIESIGRKSDALIGSKQPRLNVTDFSLAAIPSSGVAYTLLHSNNVQDQLTA